MPVVVVAALFACVLTSVAVTGSLVPGDREFAEAIQRTPQGRYLEPPADWIALWHVRGAACLVFAMLARRRRNYALAIAAALVLGADELNPVFKEAIQRDRPLAVDVIIRDPAPGYGFPSGHSMAAALFYGYALVVAAQLTAAWVRRALVTVCLVAIGLIGWDRVYDGAHWPSDVAGGWAIGALLLCVCLWLPEWVLKLAGSRSPD